MDGGEVKNIVKIYLVFIYRVIHLAYADPNFVPKILEKFLKCGNL